MTHAVPHPLNAPSAALLAELTSIVGADYALSDAAAQAPYLTEWRGRYTGRTSLVLKPGSVAEVSAILKACNAARVGVVPQAGNTGLVGGQIPHETGTEIVLSVSRLNTNRALDADASALTVDAGVTLAAVQAAAEKAGFLFPLSMASEGSCCIGGNIATNAGGVAVLAYGNMRAQVLGLEAVLADGRIWNGLSSLRKDNTGYDLKNLFIGSEGTLGVITAATLKLHPRPKDQATALVALKDLNAVAAFFRLAQSQAGPGLTAFEFMSRRALEFSLKHGGGGRAPFADMPAWSVLIELSLHEAGSATTQLEDILKARVEHGDIIDAVVSSSLSQTKDIWLLRESISSAQKPEGGSIKHDVSVPVSAIAAFIPRADALIEKLCPGARPVAFGHFGDGNVHYNVSQPAGASTRQFLARWDDISHAVHGLVVEMGGSISAEHGIGRMKRDELANIKSPVDLDLMRSIKAALDPNGILNPGKVL
jgi:FAD/FMN-containing dehydrogenase